MGFSSFWPTVNVSQVEFFVYLEITSGDNDTDEPSGDTRKLTCLSIVSLVNICSLALLILCSWVSSKVREIKSYIIDKVIHGRVSRGIFVWKWKPARSIILPFRGLSILSALPRFRRPKTVCIVVIGRVGSRVFIFSKMAWDGLWPEGSLNFLKTLLERPISNPRSIQFLTFRWSSSLKQTVHNVSGCMFQRSVKVVSSKRIKQNSSIAELKSERAEPHS